MFKKIKEFFVGKPAPAPVAEVAYKVETPALATPVAPAPVVEEVKVETPAPVVEAVVEVTPAVEAPVAIEIPAKKPRKPRAPKAAPAEKPAAKKAAPVKKAAAIKAAPKANSKKA